MSKAPKLIGRAAVEALRPAACAPERRLKGVPDEQFVEMIKWHERQAERAMGALSCGSENWEYRQANDAADAHWCAAALMRMLVKAPT